MLRNSVGECSSSGHVSNTSSHSIAYTTSSPPTAQIEPEHTCEQWWAHVWGDQLQQHDFRDVVWQWCCIAC